MFIHVKKNCLSAYGKIFRKGEVVELDDKVGESLLSSDDFEECYPDIPEKPKKKSPSKRKQKEESEDALPTPDAEQAVEK